MRHRMNGLQALAHTCFGCFEVVVGLKIQPILRCLVKRAAEPQGQLRCISSMVINDFNIEGMVALEPETHAPLAVDAYAPLTLAVAR